MMLFVAARRHLSRLVEHLDAKARSTPTVGDLTPIRVAPALLAAGVVFITSFQLAGSTGLNEEMTGGIYLHPYEFFSDRALNPEGQAGICDDGFFQQPVRPIFGLCVHGQRVPLLFNAYTSTTSYWPLWILGKVFNDYELLINRLVPGLFLLVLLVLMALQVTRHGGARLGALTVLALLLFPMSSAYATLYLYEYLPLVALSSIWWLLDRYNATGKRWAFMFAALLIGFALQQKLTAGLVLPAFLGCWVGFYGLRQGSAKLWAAAAAVAAIFPASFLTIRWLHFVVSGHILELGMAEHPVPVLDMLVLLSRWTFASLPHGGERWSTALQLLLLALLLGYCVFNAVRYFRFGTGRRFVAFASVTTLIILTSFFLIYRYHPSSLPALQFLPFVCLVIAAMITDALRAVERLIRWRWLTTGVAILLLAGVAFWRSGAYSDFIFGTLGYPTLPEQKRAVQTLLDRDAVRPVMLNSYKNGVLEFLSQGRIRPLYLTADAFTPIDEAAWRRVLDATAGRRVDFLFSRPPSPLDLVPRSNPEALARFEAALRSSERVVVSRATIPMAAGRRHLVLVSVE